MTESTENATYSLSETLTRLAILVSENGLSELSVEENGVTVTVKATVEPVSTPPGLAVPAHPHLLSASQIPAYSQTMVGGPQAPSILKPARNAAAVGLESPMVGVFYQSPSPEDPPFVAVGDLVKVGQPIGLIEAMKVYSEVPSEVSGRVIEMPVESGKLVQQGQVLIYVEPL